MACNGGAQLRLQKNKNKIIRNNTTVMLEVGFSSVRFRVTKTQYCSNQMSDLRLILKVRINY